MKLALKYQEYDSFDKLLEISFGGLDDLTSLKDSEGNSLAMVVLEAFEQMSQSYFASQDELELAMGFDDPAADLDFMDDPKVDFAKLENTSTKDLCDGINNLLIRLDKAIEKNHKFQDSLCEIVEKEPVDKLTAAQFDRLEELRDSFIDISTIPEPKLIDSLKSFLRATSLDSYVTVI